ncbi:MAG TPA: transglycosylase SLT domain-containing protein [Polyangia bacterium]
MLQAFGQNSVTNAIAAFAGMMAFPLAIPTHDAPPTVVVEHASEPAPSAAKVANVANVDRLGVSCLATTICEVKDRVRWRTAAWKPAFCEKIATAVLESSKRYAIPPSLILAVMINESDMNEKAFRTTAKNGSVYAKDGGLMGIRCIVDKQGRCTNGHVRGMAWTQVMDPVTNVDAGARELAHWRDGGGITNVTVRTRDSHGVLRTVEKHVPCAHKTHAYWAHYNHGPRYIDRGPARHYPHRIAVLYYALARAMNVDTSSLTSMRLTVNDPGKRPRTADHPVEARYQKLCQAIRDVGPVCTERSTAQLRHDRPN